MAVDRTAQVAVQWKMVLLAVQAVVLVNITALEQRLVAQQLQVKEMLVVGLMAPAVAWLMRTVSRRLYRLARSTQEANVELAYSVEENVLANRVVRLHDGVLG